MAIVSYIERLYNRKWLRQPLGYRTPMVVKIRTTSLRLHQESVFWRRGHEPVLPYARALSSEGGTADGSSPTLI